MQLTMTECRELRDLLLDESISLLSPTSPPSTPSALLAAFESEQSPIADQNPEPETVSIDTPLPSLTDLKAKSTVFPPASINKSA